MCILISFAYQNCTKTKFLVDPIAKSEALGKENVFGTQATNDGGVRSTPGNDGSISGPQPGNDGGISGIGPGDDGSTPGGTRPGNDGSTPGTQPGNVGGTPGTQPGNVGSTPGTQPGNVGSTPGTQPGNVGSTPGTQPGNVGSTPGGTMPGNDGSIPGFHSPYTTSTSILVNFAFECSDAQSDAAGGNLLTAEAIKILIIGRNKVLCELAGDFRTQILNTKKLTFTPCAGLAPGDYQVHLLDVKNTDDSLLNQKDLTRNSISFTVNADGTYTFRQKSILILYDLNNQHHRYSQLSNKYGNVSNSQTQMKCDKRSSPLIISMNSNARGIQLSSPLSGVQFDILGQNSFPKAHDKKQISWFLPGGDQEYYFIVLPNKDGRVLGIDEMFGDNTRGPDGKFSANGYEALAKYDSDKDHLITEEDEIYNDLRLWIDSNRDGVADPNELYTLKEKGVTLIDLNYDKSYQETDQYGNQTLMKSVVQTADGNLHLLFDLWFRYLNITQ